MTRRHWFIFAIIAFPTLVVLGIALLLLGAWWIAGRDQSDFIAAARQQDARIGRLYEVYPDTEAAYNDGNRAGKRGAFAPIVQTLTLSARLPNGYVLKLYRGIGVNGAIGEGAYGIQMPTGQEADLTEDEFDRLLEAHGDIGVLKQEIWTRAPLPTKNLGHSRGR